MGATQEDDIADGIMMAEDFLAGALCYMEDEHTKKVRNADCQLMS